MLADVEAVAFDFRGDPQTGDDLGDERRDHGSDRCPNDEASSRNKTLADVNALRIRMSP